MNPIDWFSHYGITLPDTPATIPVSIVFNVYFELQGNVYVSEMFEYLPLHSYICFLFLQKTYNARVTVTHTVDSICHARARMTQIQENIRERGFWVGVVGEV